MQNENYTNYNTESIRHFSDEYDISDAIDFLKHPNNFRSFDKGLIELLKRKGYPNRLDNKIEMTDYLFSKLKEIGSSITRSTVESWFLGVHHPKIESGYRRQVYEICFALQLSPEETKWFFQHVYYDRSFNYHTIDESVFFYALQNKLSYKEALNIINTVTNAPIHNSDVKPSSKFTQFVQYQLSEFNSTEDLVAFLINNKENFYSWNQSALAELKLRLDELIPTESGKEEIKKIKRTISRKNPILGVIPQLSSQKEWGLVMQEFFSEIIDVESLDEINKKNLRSNTFVLERILYTSSGLTKKADNIPYIVRNNFPSKKVMSDVLSEETVCQSKSYDSIRKMIVLLYFYSFWVRAKLGYIKDFKKTPDNTYNSLTNTFVEEMDCILLECGYEPLYAGNPFDWIFLCSTQSKNPLEYFRSCILALLPDDE